ncbi:MAG: YitT family protein [Clostridiales bacterium]|nr:YitT family protein [Clostridiales bacterium]
MKEERRTEIAKDIASDIIAGLLIAIGVYNLASAAEFPLPGVGGIALLLYQLFGLPIGLMTIVLNIPITLCTYRILGKRFFLKSVKSILISSVIMDLIAPLFPIFTIDRMLAALCCGVLSGAGYAMIFMRGSSTGGTDFISMAIRAKRPHLSIGTIIFFLDLIVIFPGAALVSGDLESLIYGIIIAYLTAAVTDKMMYGTSRGKVALIVTNKSAEVCERINDAFDRGATILKGKGSYTLVDRDVVMCACSTRQMYGIRKLIKEIDPKSFLVIMDSSDVVGEGFQSE